MKYIIISGGKGSRWNNYLGITKQEIIINNENLLERTTRLIREYDENADIIIISSNENHRVLNTILYNPTNDDNYKRKYAYELINEPIIYLYGDTFYERDSINKILEPNDTDVLFYGNSKAVVGLRVNDFELFKRAIVEYKGTKSIYNYFKQEEFNESTERFMQIGAEFYNINYGQDYEKLKRIQELLFFQRKLLCNGIIWNIGMQYKDRIITDINDRYPINNIYDIKADGYSHEFFSSLYDGYISESNIEKKYSSIGKLKSEYILFDFEINFPNFKLFKKKNQIACTEVSELKKYIRNKYKLNTGSVYDNALHISDTPIEYLNNQKVIEEFCKQEKIKLLKKEV